MKSRNPFARFMGLLSAMLMPALVCSCLFRPPEAELPENIPQKFGFTVQAVDLPVTASLLDLIQDEQISSLVKEALENNPDLSATALRLQASRLLLAQTGSVRISAVGITAERGRNNTGVDPMNGKPDTRNHYSLGLNISWEIDVWGRLADLHDEQKARHNIRTFETLHAYDSLAVRVIKTCLNIAAARRTLELQQKRVAALHKTEETIGNRYRQGLGNRDELSAARTRTMVAKADEQTLCETLQAEIRIMEVLLGRYPGELETHTLKISPITLLPTARIFEHLGKRPDVRMALLAVDAQQLAALAAHKARLPRLSLSYDHSKTSASSSSMGGSDMLWNLISNLVQPLFEGGRLVNEAQAAQLEAQACVRDLEAVVLNAVKEIEDLMGRENAFKARETHLENALAEAKKSTLFYRTRYKNGLETLPVLLNALEQEMDVHSRLIDVRAKRQGNRIDLALALGAGVPQQQRGLTGIAD